MLKKIGIALITIMVLECSLLAVLDENQRPAFFKLTSDITTIYIRLVASDQVKKKERQKDKR